jgi:hypothetical protein
VADRRDYRRRRNDPTPIPNASRQSSPATSNGTSSDSTEHRRAHGKACRALATPFACLRSCGTPLPRFASREKGAVGGRPVQTAEFDGQASVPAGVQARPCLHLNEAADAARPVPTVSRACDRAASSRTWCERSHKAPVVASARDSTVRAWERFASVSSSAERARDSSAVPTSDASVGGASGSDYLLPRFGNVVRSPPLDQSPTRGRVARGQRTVSPRRRGGCTRPGARRSPSRCRRHRARRCPRRRRTPRWSGARCRSHRGLSSRHC